MGLFSESKDIDITSDKEIMEETASNNNELIIMEVKKLLMASSWKAGDIEVIDSIFTYPSDSTANDTLFRIQSDGVEKRRAWVDGADWLEN